MYEAPRRRTYRVNLIVAVALCAACTTTQAFSPAAIPTAASMDRDVLAIVRAAIEREPFDAAPDSLFDPAATFVSNGRNRLAPPRFAGIGRGGRVRILSLSGDVNPPHAWALATYEWDSPEPNITESAKATFILRYVAGAWIIRHAHSSLVLPFERRN